MTTRSASAVWKGNLQQGTGTMKLGSGAFEGQYSFKSRFEEGTGTNPEELIGAAHAGCFSMALSHLLGEAGYTPDSIETSANVSLVAVDDGFEINRIDLKTKARIPNIDEDTFQKHATMAKEGCPVSKALAGPEITLHATLLE
ncbi:MAG: OsmC family protein [Candidatus Pacebacteria bacterium]|nr:OsmC family protein [Candidatus Paceibacterota bacterium]